MIIEWGLFHLHFRVDRREIGGLAAHRSTVSLLHTLPATDDHGLRAFLLRHGNLWKT